MSEQLSRERLDTIIRMIVSARGPKVADEIADHIIALEAENAEWKASFDLYNKAIRRGDDAWRQAHPDMDCYPDTGEMVKWLCDRNDALEAENERLRGWWGDSLLCWCYRKRPRDACYNVRGHGQPTKEVDLTDCNASPADSGKAQGFLWTIGGSIEGVVSCSYDGEYVDHVEIDGTDLAFEVGTKCEGLRIRVTIETLGVDG